MIHHHPRDLDFKLQLNQPDHFDARRDNVATAFLCKYNYDYHTLSYIFINIFQTVHFSAVKVTMDYEKNTSFLLIPNLQKALKKFDQNRAALLLH